MTTPMLVSPLVFLVVFGFTGALASAIYSRSWRRNRSIFADAAIGAVGWVIVWVVSWILLEKWLSPLWSFRQAGLALLLSIGLVHLITVRSRSGGRKVSKNTESLGDAEPHEISPSG
jgi:uncharacterized membrane protein